MNITESTRATILNALREKKKTRKWLADQLGVHNAWATRFFSGELKTLSDEHVEKLEESLGIRFFSITRKGSSTASQAMADRYDQDEHFARVVNVLGDEMTRAQMRDIHILPFIPTKDLMDFGNEIVRAAHEDPDKPGKVGRIAVEWLAKRLEKLGEKKV